jgi:hypothetical protein
MVRAPEDEGAMEPVEIAGERIDPATVASVRAGNALWPGLAAFTGVSFLVYLLVKWAGGTTPVDAGLFAQLAVAALLLAIGAAAMARGRYFFLVVETKAGRRRFGGLSKAEQVALAARLGPQSADDSAANRDR